MESEKRRERITTSCEYEQKKLFKSCHKTVVQISFLHKKIFELNDKISLGVCLDGGFRRGREGRVYFSFLNYGHYEMFFKKLTH